MVTAETPEKLGRMANEEPERGARGGLALAGAFLCAGVVVVSLTGAPPDERLTTAVVFGLLVAAPILVGLVTRGVHPDDRFAGLLIVTGAMFSLTALSQSGNDVLYSVGRVAAWLVVPLLLFLMLSFPSGRLATRRDRRVMTAVGALALTLYLPTALIVDYFPEPSPWARCDVDCPENAFAVVHVDVGFVDDFIRPVRELLLVIAAIAVAALLADRMRRSGPLLRRAISPVLVVAVVQVVAFAAYQWSRRSGTVPATVDLLGWLWLLSLPAVALSFAAGLVNRRLHVASALQDLALRLRAPASAAELRSRLADALEDPSLRVVYWLPGDPGRWVDESGWPARPPDREPGCMVTEVVTDGRRLAAVVHDAVLATDAALIEAAAAYGLVVLENTRLIGELQSSLERLSESESRGATAARGERERIERDLHDGAQQRLVALRVKLALLAERLNGDSPGHAAEFKELGRQIEMTINEVRSLAHEPYPDLLAREGLDAALRAAATAAPIRTTVVGERIGRFAQAVETTVYFSCLEAVQNAVKHAHGATRITILLTAGDQLRFEVCDDGPGFPDTASSSGLGLANIKERLATVGGQLTIASRSGGTRIVGTIPIGH
jgi:Histidine kinase/Histidine kinase-, DNA gyrase B-, and HSP90-like ATPase